MYNEYFSANMLLTFVLIWAGLIIYSADGLIQLKNQKEYIQRLISIKKLSFYILIINMQVIYIKEIL